MIKVSQRMAKEHAKQQTQAELQKAHKRIAELERSVTRAQQQPPPTDSTDDLTHKKEIEAQIVATEKAKRALRKEESEIDCLRGELRQSSERERDIQAKGRKAVKILEEQLSMEHAAHDLTTNVNNRLREEVSKLKHVNQRLWNVLEERKVGYEEQLKHEREEVQQVQILLEKEKGQLVNRHKREARI